jgi:hypothetical protein
MIDQSWKYCKWTKLNGFAVLKVLGGIQLHGIRDEIGCCANNAFGCFPHNQWDLRVDLRDQPPVISVAVT